MQGKLGFFFGGLAALCYLWAFFRVPETKGRTYGTSLEGFKLPPRSILGAFHGFSSLLAHERVFTP